jgi:hypothetical protein
MKRKRSLVALGLFIIVELIHNKSGGPMKSVLLTLISFFTVQVQAHEFHTPNYCSTQVKNFCAHIGYSSQPEVNKAFEFVVDLVATPDMLAQVKTANVALFMTEMGHGTAPVKVERLDLKHFQVSEAYFVMEGQWSVNVEVVTDRGTVLIQIPFEIK